MKVLIVCVNYNSYTELEAYLKSIDRAAGLCEQVSVRVVVADNSTKPQPLGVALPHVRLEVRPLGNLGYFGAAAAVLNEDATVPACDYVAISNVDLVMQDDFFQKLAVCKFAENVGWVAPCLYLTASGRDRNPLRMHRPSKRRLQWLCLMFRFPILQWLYLNTIFKRKKYVHDWTPRNVWEGNGGFILLTRRYFEHYPRLDYPVFLYGEELYMAERMERAGLAVYYYPELRLNDAGSVSTSKMAPKTKSLLSVKALQYAINRNYLT